MRLVTLRRVSRLLALFPLLAYLVFHAWEHWPVRQGRDAVLARLEHTSHPWLELGLVLAPWSFHAVVAVMIARRSDGSGYASKRHHGLQVATGVLALAFVLLHGSAVWLPKFGDLLPLNAAYNAMREQASTLLGLCWYVLGLGAVCTHVGQGVGTALIEEGGRVLGVRAARTIGVAIGLALYVVFVCELAVYATGAALL